MKGNASKDVEKSDVGQIVEFLGSLSKAVAPIAVRMTRGQRQYWIELSPERFAEKLANYIFQPPPEN
jgi:hypothetical protein